MISPVRATVKKGGGRVGVVGNGEVALKSLADEVSEEEHWKGSLDLFERFDLI